MGSSLQRDTINFLRLGWIYRYGVLGRLCWVLLKVGRLSVGEIQLQSESTFTETVTFYDHISDGVAMSAKCGRWGRQWYLGYDRLHYRSTQIRQGLEDTQTESLFSGSRIGMIFTCTKLLSEKGKIKEILRSFVAVSSLFICGTIYFHISESSR